MPMEYRGYEERLGKIAEVFPFGRVKVDNPDYERGLKECMIKKGAERINCGFELVKKFQPFDPANPQKLFLKDLLGNFVEKTGLEKEKARIFTAVDSIIDKEMGADAFIEVLEDDGTSSIIRIDGTLSSEKLDEKRTKSDVLVDLGDLPDPMEDKEGYKKRVQDIAVQTAEKYREKFLKTRKAA